VVRNDNKAYTHELARGEGVVIGRDGGKKPGLWGVKMKSVSREHVRVTWEEGVNGTKDCFRIDQLGTNSSWLVLPEKPGAPSLLRSDGGSPYVSHGAVIIIGRFDHDSPSFSLHHPKGQEFDITWTGGVGGGGKMSWAWKKEPEAADSDEGSAIEREPFVVEPYAEHSESSVSDVEAVRPTPSARAVSSDDDIEEVDLVIEEDEDEAASGGRKSVRKEAEAKPSGGVGSKRKGSATKRSSSERGAPAKRQKPAAAPKRLSSSTRVVGGSSSSGQPSGSRNASPAKSIVKPGGTSSAQSRDVKGILSNEDRRSTPMLPSWRSLGTLLKCGEGDDEVVWFRVVCRDAVLGGVLLGAATPFSEARGAMSKTVAGLPKGFRFLLGGAPVHKKQEVHLVCGMSGTVLVVEPAVGDAWEAPPSAVPLPPAERA
jgi:hypothetical protein